VESVVSCSMERAVPGLRRRDLDATIDSAMIAKMRNGGQPVLRPARNRARALPAPRRCHDRHADGAGPRSPVGAVVNAEAMDKVDSLAPSRLAPVLSPV
jgi:hypothetical protein